MNFVEKDASQYSLWHKDVVQLPWKIEGSTVYSWYLITLGMLLCKT